MSIKNLCNLAIVIVVFVFIAKTINSNDDKMSSKLVGLDFEVFGLVQGVFFRKATQKRAETLNLKGWCMNTKHDTVIGRIEGDKSNVEEMKQWLQTTGSKASKIDRAEFKNEQEIDQINFPDFSIKK